MKLLDFYIATLEAVNMKTSSDGYISFEIDETGQQPVLVNGKRLVLPTTENLRKGESGNLSYFNPLKENILKGASPILQKYREAINTKLMFSFSVLFAELLTIAASSEEHKLLTPDQSEILSILKKIDEKSLQDFTKIVGKAEADNKDAFVYVFLKQGATFKGVKYKRGTVVNFPFYDELCEDKDTVFGVKLRNSDRKQFKALMEYIFPEITDKEAYNYGSNDLAPSFTSLLGALYKLGAAINQVLNLFKDKVDSPESIEISAEWGEYLDRTDSFLPEIRLLPLLDGNEGNGLPSTPYIDTTPQTNPLDPVPATPIPHVNPTAAPAPYQPAPAVGAPMQQSMTPAPMPVTPPPASNGKVSLGQVMASIQQPPPMYQPNPYQTAIYPQQPYQPFYPQQQMMQRPMYQPPMYPQQAPVQTVPGFRGLPLRG